MAQHALEVVGDLHPKGASQEKQEVPILEVGASHAVAWVAATTLVVEDEATQEGGDADTHALAVLAAAHARQVRVHVHGCGDPIGQPPSS